jgi:hypothetical protein
VAKPAQPAKAKSVEVPFSAIVQSTPERFEICRMFLATLQVRQQRVAHVLITKSCF